MTFLLTLQIYLFFEYKTAQKSYALLNCEIIKHSIEDHLREQQLVTTTDQKHKEILQLSAGETCTP